MSAVVASLVKDVEHARARVLDAVAGVTSAQGAWKPAPEDCEVINTQCVEEWTKGDAHLYIRILPDSTIVSVELDH